MLVFIDESGDSGLKLDQGSSSFFVVTLVSFESHGEAQAADNEVNEIRKDLGLPSNFEFHFSKAKPEFRQRFLARMANFDFFYYGIVINKAKLYGPGFHFKEPFYKYTCNLVFNNAKPHLSEATVIVDGSGSREFRSQLEKYFKSRINPKEGLQHIKKVKVQDSKENNLLQLADMVCGAVAREYRTNRSNDVDYRRLISHREMYVQVWPKK